MDCDKHKFLARDIRRCMFCEVELLQSKLDAMTKARDGAVRNWKLDAKCAGDLADVLRRERDEYKSRLDVAATAKLDMEPRGRCGKCGSPIWPSELTGTTCNCVVEKLNPNG